VRTADFVSDDQKPLDLAGRQVDHHGISVAVVPGGPQVPPALNDMMTRSIV
jgi:hypothetical protein